MISNILKHIYLSSSCLLASVACARGNSYETHQAKEKKSATESLIWNKLSIYIIYIDLLANYYSGRPAPVDYFNPNSTTRTLARLILHTCYIKLGIV